MALFEIPKINPIRLSPNINNIEWWTYFPKFDKMNLDTEYIVGETPVNFRPEFVSHKLLKFQIKATVESPIIAKIYNSSGTSHNMTVTNITPVGWVGNTVWQITYTPTVEDYYFCVFEIWTTRGDYLITSDEFKVNLYSNQSANKKLIEIKYRNSVNDFDMVFDSNYYLAYFPGVISESDGEVENTIWKTDTGTNILESNSYSGIDLTICDISKRYKETIRKIFQCDDILVNGINCICTENPSSEATANSDIINMNIHLTLKQSNNLVIY